MSNPDEELAGHIVLVTLIEWPWGGKPSISCITNPTVLKRKLDNKIQYTITNPSCIKIQKTKHTYSENFPSTFPQSWGISEIEVGLSKIED